MRAVLPGRPQARYQAVTTGFWEGRQIVAYISGNAIIVLDSPTNLLQTTYQETPDDLVAVVFDEISGKIAAASKRAVHIYKPYGQEEGAIRWSLQCHLSLENENDTIETLSWGLDEELLVGSSCLTLFSTFHGENRLWSKRLANPARFALFAHDTSLIVTCGRFDKVVKVWRPMSLADQRFEYAYLPHPGVVTGIYWRKPFHREQTVDNVLYTLCADNKLRIWVPGDPLNNDILKLWDEIDLMQSIQPRSLAPEDRSNKRYAFIIDSKDITAATERAVQRASSDEHEQHALSHLIEVANRSPEVCVVFDDRGNMSAWGLDSVNCKARKSGDVFNVAHTEGMDIHFNRQSSDEEDNVQFQSFCDTGNEGNLVILMNHFDGRLEWYESRLDKLFDPSPQKARLSAMALWTGHAGPIKKIIRTTLGRAVISRTTDNESVIWSQSSSDEGRALQRRSRVLASDHIHRACLLRDGKFVVFLHHESISLWDCRNPIAKEISRRSYNIEGKPLCLICLPEEDAGTGILHLITVSSEMKGLAWEVKLPASRDNNEELGITDFDAFELGSAKDLAYVLAVDPAGTAPVLSGFLDTFARDVAISWTTFGVIKTWTAKPDLSARKVLWLNTATVATMIDQPSIGSATSIRKAALVDTDRTKLTIWSTMSGQLEHEEKFETMINDLDWSSTPDNQSILAVGFDHRVLIYAQLRFDYLDARPSWAVIKQISIREYTSHPIGDSVWLGNGNLIIGAGNQLFVDDNVLTITHDMDADLRDQLPAKKTQDIFEVISRLNGPLPVYHPQCISQTVLSGKIVLAQRILVKLWKTMRFYSDDEPFDAQLGFTDEDFTGDADAMVRQKKLTVKASYADLTDDEAQTVTEDIASSLSDILASRRIPFLSPREQLHLADILECAAVAEKHRRSIDENGARFLLFFRQHVLRSNRQSADMLSCREIVWAYHSQSQDILTDIVSKHFHARMLWTNAKESGIFMWMTDPAALLVQFETIARNEYTKSDDKNPIDCSLYYLALRKKAVLVGLWRMASLNKEQSATHKLLSNNFNEPRWRTAALKNAYALMGRRRFEYAAAFFLLADKLGDAVNVLANQHNDLQLAIAVARIYGGDDCVELRSLIEDRVLPQAAMEGNRWLATWAYWMLGRRDKAVRALVSPLTSLMSPSETPNMQSKLFSTDDPALIVLYRQLRDKSLQTLKGALSISPREEWAFILHTARLYGRMGCDLLALDLVRSWEFLLPVEKPRRASSTIASSLSVLSPTDSSFSATNDPDIDPRKLLRRRSSLVVDDMSGELRRPSLSHLRSHNTHSYDADASHPSAIDEAEENDKSASTNDNTESKPDTAAPTKKPPPTQFKEPDASSLLDAFGF